jgi:hypothetical protein
MIIEITLEARTSENSVYYYDTARWYIPESYQFQSYETWDPEEDRGFDQLHDYHVLAKISVRAPKG